MMERREERLARLAFQQQIERIYGADGFDWEQVDDDPPDYFFTIDGVKYGVEATTIPGTVLVRGIPEPIMKTRGMLADMERNLEAKARNEGVLHGFYWVGVHNPVRRSREMVTHLKSEILRFVESTQDEREASHEITYPLKLPDGTPAPPGAVRMATIRKLPKKKDALRIQTTYVGREERAQEEACTRLKEAVVSKAAKLRKNNCPKPWILLLLHAHDFAEAEIYRERCEEFKGLEEFHSILIARPSGSGSYFLTGPWKEQARQ